MHAQAKLFRALMQVPPFSYHWPAQLSTRSPHVFPVYPIEQMQVNCPLTQDPPFMQLLRIGRAVMLCKGNQTMCTLNCIHEFIRKPHHVCHYIDFLLVEMDIPLYTHDGMQGCIHTTVYTTKVTVHKATATRRVQ